MKSPILSWNVIEFNSINSFSVIKEERMNRIIHRIFSFSRWFRPETRGMNSLMITSRFLFFFFFFVFSKALEYYLHYKSDFKMISYSNCEFINSFLYLINCKSISNSKFLHCRQQFETSCSPNDMKKNTSSHSFSYIYLSLHNTHNMNRWCCYWCCWR